MIKKLPKSEIEITQTIAWDEWKKYLDMAVAEISKELKIPGFRPGKAPRPIVEQKVGQEAILNQAAEKAIQKNYIDYINKEKIVVLSSPQVFPEEIKEKQNLIYKARVTVMPEVTVNDRYKNDIKKINEDYKIKNIKVDEAEIQLELDKLANSRVKLVTVRREAKNNDAVEIDFAVSINGIPIENGSNKKHPLIIGKGVFIPGFEEQLLGMKENEEKEFSLTFPESYHQKNLAGKLAVFKVKMNMVQDRQLPEINDEFAKSLGKFEHLADLKKNIQEGLEHEKKHKLEEKQRNDYMEKILDQTTVDLPDLLIFDELRKMFEELEYQIQAMGMPLDDYLKKINKDRQSLEKDWTPQAIKRVKSALVIRQIAKMENIEIDKLKIEAEMNKNMAYYKSIKAAEKNIDLERLYNYTKNMLENEEVFLRLAKI